MRREKKKLPYFIGIGMIVAGIISMIVSGRAGDAVKPYIVFGGVMIFIAGFAGTIIYSMQQDVPEEEKKKPKPMTRTKIMLMVCGMVCLLGFLALLAGFIFFEQVNMLLFLLGMAAFIGSGSAIISIFTKHKSEFIPDENAGDNNTDDAD